MPSSPENISPERQYKVKPHVIYKTTLYYFLFSAMGSIYYLPIATQENIENSLIPKQNVDLIYVVRPVGCIVGSIFSAFVLHKFKLPELFLIFQGFVISILIISTAFFHTYSGIIASFSLIGLFYKGFEIGINVLILKLWRHFKASIYHGLYFSFSFGILIAYVFSNAFERRDQKINFPHLMPYGYIILGCEFIVLMLLSSILIYSTWDERFTIFESHNILEYLALPSSIVQPKTKSLILILITASLVIFLEQSIELTYSQAVPEFPHSTAYKIQQKIEIWSTFWIPYILSRIIAAFASRYFCNKVFVINSILTLFAALLILLLEAYYAISILWITSILVGWGLGPFFPAMILWISEFVELNFTITSILFTAAAFAEATMPYLLLRTPKRDSKKFYIYMMMAISMELLLCILLNYLFLHANDNFEHRSSVPCNRIRIIVPTANEDGTTRVKTYETCEHETEKHYRTRSLSFQYFINNSIVEYLRKKYFSMRY